MTNRSREVVEGIQIQGEDERIVYTLNTSLVSHHNPAIVKVVVYDDLRNDVTNTVMPTNDPSSSGHTITLSPIMNLTAGKLYRVEIEYEVTGNTLESYFYIQAEL